MSDHEETQPGPESESNGEEDASGEQEPSLPSQSGSEQDQEDPMFVEIPVEKYQDLQEKAQEREEALDRLRRVSADYDNYQKRMRRKRKEDREFANRKLVKALLPVLDDFDQALSENSGDHDDLREGVEMIYRKFLNALRDAGVEQFGEEGSAFDPEKHEAASILEMEDVDRKQVMEVLRKGYRMHDRCLRPARVVIARPPGKDET